ncbi:MAG TPA: hypothetical protein VFS68_11250, partial [Candidatus Udaeobacter sp.]|nr:hypothetical protein [Candidatus Udaeobacter sp.]
GVSVGDALELVQKQALLEKKSRLEVLQRIQTAGAFLEAPAPTEMVATNGLYETWDKLKLEKDETVLKELRSSRVAVVAALCELANFWHLCSGPKDEDTDAKLVNSGLSLCSSVISITMGPYFGTLKDSARTLSWKFTGGFLSALGSFVSAWIDNQHAKEKWRSGQYESAVILRLKALGGALIGVAYAMDAISTAAPIFKKLAARSGSRVIIAAVTAVTDFVAAEAVLRVVAFFITWEGAVALTALQLVADHVMPDALEIWCALCAFGTGRRSILRVKEVSVHKYTEIEMQQKDFDSAMVKTR